MAYCCEQMARQVEHTCAQHPDLYDCPDALVIRRTDIGEFGLRIHDGGSSYVAIRHCPWCGSDLIAHGASELGKPSLQIAGLQLWIDGRQFPESDDFDDGNLLRITARCGGAGASVAIQGSVLMVTDIERFAKQCEGLYAGASASAILESFEPELRILLERTDRLGHLRAKVDITADHLAQSHRFEFDIDQSYLPGIVDDCAAIIRAYPIRGRESI
jgi:hypothetical protein